MWVCTIKLLLWSEVGGSEKGCGVSALRSQDARNTVMRSRLSQAKRSWTSAGGGRGERPALVCTKSLPASFSIPFSTSPLAPIPTSFTRYQALFRGEPVSVPRLWSCLKPWGLFPSWLTPLMSGSRVTRRWALRAVACAVAAAAAARRQCTRVRSWGGGGAGLGRGPPPRRAGPAPPSFPPPRTAMI